METTCKYSSKEAKNHLTRIVPYDVHYFTSKESRPGELGLTAPQGMAQSTGLKAQGLF
jgi:hypothetical protein